MAAGSAHLTEITGATVSDERGCSQSLPWPTTNAQQQQQQQQQMRCVKGTHCAAQTCLHCTGLHSTAVVLVTILLPAQYMLTRAFQTVRYPVQNDL
jgi:hypothetical protein